MRRRPLGHRHADHLKLVIERDEEGQPIPASELDPALYRALQQIQTAVRLALKSESDVELAERLAGMAEVSDQATGNWLSRVEDSRNPAIPY